MIKFAIVLLSALALAQSAAIDEVSPFLDGGPTALPGQFPWHVHIQPIDVNANFSGVLINPSWVLTCAACINKSPVGHELLFGALDLDNDGEPNRVTRSIGPSDVYIYPGYDPAQFNVDNIALVKLPAPIATSLYIDLIPLTDGSSQYEDVVARVSGFGFESSNVTSGQQLLRYTDLTILPDSSCRNLATGQMCAELITPEIGPCRDEGSALYVSVPATGRASLVGVFSYGYAEGSCPGTRTLFTRVSNYLDWIEETITAEVTTPPTETSPATEETTTPEETTTTIPPTTV